MAEVKQQPAEFTGDCTYEQNYRITATLAALRNEFPRSQSADGVSFFV
jgi:hypothetical protein